MDAQIPRGPKRLLHDRVAAIRYGNTRSTRPSGKKRQVNSSESPSEIGSATSSNIGLKSDENFQHPVKDEAEDIASSSSAKEKVKLNAAAAPYTASKPSREKMKYFTCAYWANGRCRYSAEECLYAHQFTPRVTELPKPVECGGPPVAGKNARAKKPIYTNWRDLRSVGAASEGSMAEIRQENVDKEGMMVEREVRGVGLRPISRSYSPLLSTTPDQDIVANSGQDRVVVNLPGSRPSSGSGRIAEATIDVDEQVQEFLLSQDLLSAIEDYGNSNMNLAPGHQIVVPPTAHHPDLKISLQVHDLLISRRDSENAVNYWRSMVPQLMAQKRDLEAMYGQDRTQVQGDAIIEQVLSINHFVTKHHDSVRRGNEMLEGYGLGHLCKEIKDDSGNRGYVRGWRKEDDDEWY